jgi:hypothetical protein
VVKVFNRHSTIAQCKNHQSKPMTQLTANTAAIGKVTPFTIAYARYIINQEYAETGAIDPASIRAKMFQLYDYFFQYEWEQIWLAIQSLSGKKQKVASQSRLIATNKGVTSSFVAQSLKSQPWSFYSSRRHTHSELSSGGLELKKFRDSLIWQALKTLGLESDADFKTAQKAYRILMRDNHPDKFAAFGDPKINAEKEAFCVAINTAWEFVKDWLPQP